MWYERTDTIATDIIYFSSPSMTRVYSVAWKMATTNCVHILHVKYVCLFPIENKREQHSFRRSRIHLSTEAHSTKPPIWADWSQFPHLSFKICQTKIKHAKSSSAIERRKRGEQLSLQSSGMVKKKQKQKQKQKQNYIFQNQIYYFEYYNKTSI